MTDQPPLVGGRYRLLALLTASGQTERWAAADTVLARTVVLERADPTLGSAFDAAVATSARLAHPGIVAVYDTGVEDGRPYVVTELPPGRNLRTVLDAAGPLPPERVTRIGLHLTAALAAAHRAGVLHGRLSLDEVVVDEDDHVKIGDFGGAPPGATAGADVVAAADLLYELLCGGPPATDDLTPRRARPGVPPMLDRAITLGRAGSATAENLHQALTLVDTTADDAVPIVSREPTPPTGVRPVARPRGRKQLGGIAALTIVAVGLAVVAVLLATGSGTSSRGAPPSPAGGQSGGAAVTITQVRAFDPLGDNQEDDARLPLVDDGNPATVWSTETYTNRNFGNLKSGVGLYLVLDGRHALKTLTVDSPLTGWSAQVYVAAVPGTSLAAWGPAVAAFAVNGPVTRVDLHGVRGGAVLVWITELADANRVDIGELRLT